MIRPHAKRSATPAVDLLALAEYVERFSSKTIVVLGDFVADAFQFGDITRVSREAPVLILKHRETQIVPGGGANAANNFASLGAKVIPITAVGEDEPGHRLREFFRAKKIDVSGIFPARGWTTPTKTRFLAGWAHKVGQQVLRVDYEPDQPLPSSIHQKIHAKSRPFHQKSAMPSPFPTTASASPSPPNSVNSSPAASAPSPRSTPATICPPTPGRPPFRHPQRRRDGIPPSHHHREKSRRTRTLRPRHARRNEAAIPAYHPRP